MARRGGPKQPYTTGYIDGEFHFIKRLAPVLGEGPTQWEATCRKIGPVADLKDRTAVEVLAIEDQCHGCITTGWRYHLGREADREG